MTTFRQIQANRRNALKSTGPSTHEGKQRSRCNAVRHGLTAETVIASLEDADDYRAFEAAITADYDADSAVERELVLRLAGLLWRLRRAGAIETGLFEFEDLSSSKFRNRQHPGADKTTSLHLLFRASTHQHFTVENEGLPQSGRGLASRFMVLADCSTNAIDRLSRYEAALWRQTRQIILTLQALDRRKPCERRRHSRSSHDLFEA